MELQHIAIIMDGNRRWAKSKRFPQIQGHRKGADNLTKICRAVWEAGIRYLTVYAFSTENWKRSPQEVEDIMNLARKFLKNSVADARKNQMRVRVIGNKSGLAKDIQESIQELEEASRDFSGLTLQIALNYGGRDEITRAARRIAEAVAAGELASANISEAIFERYLDTAGIPDPELLIRTGGEKRISNYLLWQIAYSEVYVTDVFWPDFDEAELQRAVNYYFERNRRFGGK